MPRREVLGWSWSELWEDIPIFDVISDRVFIELPFGYLCEVIRVRYVYAVTRPQESPYRER